MSESCHTAAADSSLSASDGWTAASVNVIVCSVYAHCAGGMVFSDALMVSYSVWVCKLNSGLNAGVSRSLQYILM